MNGVADAPSTGGRRAISGFRDTRPQTVLHESYVPVIGSIDVFVRLQAWRGKNTQIEDDSLRTRDPAHFGHINFRGTFPFAAIQRHRDALIELPSIERTRSSG